MSAFTPYGRMQSNINLPDPDLGPENSNPYYGLARYPGSSAYGYAGYTGASGSAGMAGNLTGGGITASGDDPITPRPQGPFINRLGSSIGNAALRSLTGGILGRNPINPIIGDVPTPDGGTEPVYEGRVVGPSIGSRLAELYHGVINANSGGSSPSSFTTQRGPINGPAGGANGYGGGLWGSPGGMAMISPGLSTAGWGYGGGGGSFIHRFSNPLRNH